MRYKLSIILSLSFLINTFLIPFHTFAEVKVNEAYKKMVFYFSTTDLQPDENVYFIESMFSAFAKKTLIISDEEAEEKAKDIKDADLLVYIGSFEKKLDPNFTTLLSKSNVPLIVFGSNVEQFSTFEGWRREGEVSVRKVDQKVFEVESGIHVVTVPETAKIISSASNYDNTYPFIVQEGDNGYVATVNFDSTSKYVLAKAIYSLLKVEESVVHPAYLRLEDISPFSDPKLVKETGDYLADRNIPFFMAIIPVYINSETGEMKSIEDNKELLNVLLYLQERGGQVISHGYTHSYRLDETGEGFEFWDVKLNQPITTERTDIVPEPIRKVSTFNQESEYIAYRKKMQSIETKYIEGKLTKSIETLARIGLKPIAFEAPHYTMSSNGYRVASAYFSEIFGQIQYSDSNWEIMETPLFISRPKILSGMRLFPETIGYIDPNELFPLENMQKAIEKVSEVPGAVIGGFYHPYLGLEYLPDIVKMIEAVPNIEWIKLPMDDTTFVKTENVSISVNQKDEITMISKQTKKDELMRNIREQPFNFSLWIVTSIVILFLVAFSFHIIFLRLRLKKRLFEERDSLG